MSIDADKQSLSPGNLVVLWVLDCTALGGSIHRFCSSFDHTLPVYWGGHMYQPVPVEAEGFEVNGRGSLPTPKVRIANVKQYVTLLTEATGSDILGATLTRYKTYSKYLDSGATPSTTQHYPEDVYVIERKSASNPVLVEWELSAAMDHEGRMLPGRQILRDSCDLRYRFWSAGAFDYTKATCPYTGSTFFDKQGQEVATGDLDKCGKRLSDCRLRFGTAPLPFGGFPMVARIRL